MELEKKKKCLNIMVQDYYPWLSRVDMLTHLQTFTYTYTLIGWQCTRGFHSVPCICVTVVEESGCLKKDRREMFGSVQYLHVSS